jgi:hypothetical protein
MSIVPGGDPACFRRACCALIGILLASAPPAWGQVTRPWDIELLGTTGQVKSPAIRGTDSAYDPDNNRYLVVGSCYGSTCASGFGPVFGILADGQGNPLGSLFSIKSGSGGAHFPRVRYSPDVNGGQGGFLVTWAEELNGVHTRVVAENGSLVGSENVISTAGGVTVHPWIEGAAAVAYSPTSQRFLVAWAQNGVAKVVARLVGLDGSGVGSLVTLSSGINQAYYTGVSWSSSTNHFGVSFIGEGGGSVSYVFARVSASDGSFTRQTFSQISGLGGATDVDYNPSTNRFVMAGWQGPSGAGARVRAWEIDATGNVLATGVVSTQMVGYNSISLARNPVSGTYLLVSLPSSDATLGLELNGRGFPQGSHTTLASGVVTRYARVAANSENARWAVTFSDGLTSFKDLIAATATTNGGSSTAHPAVGGGTPPPPTGCSTPSPGTGWTCVNGNWLPPASSCTTPSPGTGWTCVNGNWLPPSTGGGGGGGTGGCTTIQPAPDWTCVNGNWLPPGMTGGSTPPPPSGCATPSPGTGWTCVNGNWLPPSTGGSNCSSIKPGPDWVCVNGNWLPPGMVPGGGSSGGGGTGGTGETGGTFDPLSLPVCTNSTGAPASGWIKVGSNWVPPTYPTASQGTCRAP